MSFDLKRRKSRNKKLARPKKRHDARQTSRAVPQATPETPVETPVTPLTVHPAAGPDPAPNEGILDGERASVRPEIHTLVRQSHGGALRVGNPGNAGGGRHPEKVRERLRELLTVDGIPLLERTMRREEVDYRAIVVEKEIKVVALPVDTRVAVVAAQIVLEASEGKVSPEKSGLTKRRALEIVLRRQLIR